MGKPRQQILDEPTTALTFDEIERAVDAGKVEMKRPWGDWVSVCRRGPTVKREEGHRQLHVWMENEVEGSISSCHEAIGFPDVRIVP